MIDLWGMKNYPVYQANHISKVNILFLFDISFASVRSQLKAYSSSLLSLSRSGSSRKTYRICWQYCFLSSFDSARPRIYLVYLNLRESLVVLSSIITNILSPASQQVAKQGPAVIVTPVLTPIKFFLRKSLFVFSQTTSCLTPL